jgi:hypothetical protein
MEHNFEILFLNIRQFSGTKYINLGGFFPFLNFDFGNCKVPNKLFFLKAFLNLPFWKKIPNKIYATSI